MKIPLICIDLLPPPNSVDFPLKRTSSSCSLSRGRQTIELNSEETKERGVPFQQQQGQLFRHLGPIFCVPFRNRLVAGLVKLLITSLSDLHHNTLSVDPIYGRSYAPPSPITRTLFVPLHSVGVLQIDFQAPLRR